MRCKSLNVRNGQVLLKKCISIAIKPNSSAKLLLAFRPSSKRSSINILTKFSTIQPFHHTNHSRVSLPSFTMHLHIAIAFRPKVSWYRINEAITHFPAPLLVQIIGVFWRHFVGIWSVFSDRLGMFITRPDATTVEDASSELLQTPSLETMETTGTLQNIRHGQVATRYQRYKKLL